MKKSSYNIPTFRVVHLDTICEGELMEGSGYKYENGEVGDGDVDATRSFDHEWEWEWE